SRTRSLPRLMCRARACSLPPCLTASSFVESSSTSRFMTSALRVKAAALGSTLESRTVIGAPRRHRTFHSVRPRASGDPGRNTQASGDWVPASAGTNGEKEPPLALARLVEQLGADQHAADLARPGADLVELGVTQQA